MLSELYILTMETASEGGQTTAAREWILGNTAHLLFILAFCVNLAAVLIRWNFADPMTWENGEIARNLIQGRGFSSTYLTGSLHTTSVMAPVYSFFLAGVYAVFGVSPSAHAFVQILQAVVGAGAVVVMYFISRRLFDQQVGLIAGAGMALFPDYVYAVSVIHQLVFTTFLMLLLVYTMLWFDEQPTDRRALAVGGVLGATILTFPMALVFSPFVALWIFLQQREGAFLTVDGKIRSLRPVMIVTLTTMALVAPWAVRNMLVHDKFMIMKLVGWNFYRGNAPPAIHTGIPNVGADIPQQLHEQIRSSSEAQADSLLFHTAWDYVIAHPFTFITKCIKSVWYLWWFPPALDVHTSQVSFLRKVAYTPVFIAGIAGIIYTRDRWKDLLLPYSVLIAFTLGYAIFFVLPRYKVPTIQLILIIFAAVTASRICRWVRRYI